MCCSQGGRNDNWILRFLINGNVTPLTVTYLMDKQHSESKRYIQVKILLKLDEVFPFICITHVLTTVKNTWHEFLISLQPQPLNTPLTMQNLDIPDSSLIYNVKQLKFMWTMRAPQISCCSSVFSSSLLRVQMRTENSPVL